MEAVLKVGGSLAEDPSSLRRLCQELSELAKAHRIAIIPGGGEFADTVRMLDKTFGLSDVVAHKMAILAMDQYGLLLSDLIPNSWLSYSLEEKRKEMLSILLPSQLMFREDPLENSWDVTSDTITAFIAAKVNAKKLILVTDVDGIFTEDPKQNLDAKHIDELTAEELLGWNKRTSVDKVLPEIVLKYKLDCYVVNGKYPERIKLILENKKTICTHVTA